MLLSGCSPNNPAPTALSNDNPASVTQVGAADVHPTSTATASFAAPGSGKNCPLTGLPLNGVNLDSRRPLMIKIGNSPAERPQSGLAQADIVFEHLTEGAITRFSAVYYCSAADDIGPVRSARLIDLELAPMFNAIFAHVGGSEPVRQLIAESEIAGADLDDYGRAPIFREVATRKRPFNRYTSTKDLWELAARHGWIPGSGVAPLSFSTDLPAGGRATNSITIPYRAGLSDVKFTYDAAAGSYSRGFGAAPHTDAISGKPLSASNVVVLFAPHTTTSIVEDSLGSHSIKITLTGSGKAVIFRDGNSYDATWERGDPHAMLRFTGADGKALTFRPGTIWFQVVPQDMPIKTQ